MYLIKLISKTRNYYSIGEDHAGNLSTLIHSDTLFSALCNNIRLLEGKEVLKEFLAAVQDSLKTGDGWFKLSSCFHYIDIYKDQKQLSSLFFLPAPLKRFTFTEEAQSYLEGNPKLFKKVEYLSSNTARKLQKGEPLSFNAFYLLDDSHLLDDKDLEILGWKKWVQKKIPHEHDTEFIAIKEKIKLLRQVEEQRVRIKRCGFNISEAKSEPFTRSKLYLTRSNYFIRSEDARLIHELVPGFYFLLDPSGLKEAHVSILKAAIKLLTDNGIGGERSLGAGLFDDVVIEPLEKEPNLNDLFSNGEESNHREFMNLSLVYPATPKIDMKHVKFYSLLDRTGYCYSLDSKTQRFLDVKFIKEGSVFTGKIKGKLVQVASKEFARTHHEVYKNGIGFYMNIGPNQAEEGEI